MEGDLVVGLVGSLYSGRGVLELVDAVVLARRAGAPVRVRIAGFGSASFLAELEQRAVKLEREAAYEFVGPIPYREVPSFYDSIDLGVVLYSAVDRAQDSLSNKLFECLSAGRGVLATNLPETKNLVERLRVGVCVDVDADEIAAVLVRLSQIDRGQVASFAGRAVAACEAEFNWAAQRENLEGYLNETLQLTRH